MLLVGPALVMLHGVVAGCSGKDMNSLGFQATLLTVCGVLVKSPHQACFLICQMGISRFPLQGFCGDDKGGAWEKSPRPRPGTWGSPHPCWLYQNGRDVGILVTVT